MPDRTALLIGATGLIGRHCLNRLLAEPAYTAVHVLARREPGVTDARLHVRVLDFAAITAADVPAVDDVYNCLGTTIRTAGSQDAMYRIDHDHPLTVATHAHAAGARRLAHVSSIGADASSRNFYLRLKGETDRDLEALGYDTLEVFRPSALLGRREPARPRDTVAQAVARAVAPAMLGRLRAFRPVEGAVVADAMVASLLTAEAGAHIRTFDEINRLAGVRAAA